MSGQRSRGPGWADGWTAPLLVALAAIAPASLALRGAFVFDDARFIVENPYVQKTPAFLKFFTDGTTIDPAAPGGIVRPLRSVEFAIDRMLFGSDTLGFHIHSLLWHIVTALLVLAVLRRLVGDARIAFVAALVFAVHPAHVESVAWISSRGDVAMGACVMASVLFALRSGGMDANFGLSLAAAAVALLYKEAAVSLPLVILALRWTKLARVPSWPYVLLVAAYLVYRSQVLPGPTGHGVTFVLGASAEGTFATMIRGFGFYLADAVLPAQSTDWYLSPSTSFADGAVILWLCVHTAIVVSAVRARRVAPLWTLAVAWFYAFLLPVANWPYFLQIPTADRFLYMPLAGAVIALAYLLRTTPRNACAAVLVAAVALAGSSVLRSRTWGGDDDLLWRTVLADHGSPRAHAYVGAQTRLEALAIRERESLLPQGPERQALAAERTRLLEDSLDHLHRALDLWYRFELSTRSQGILAHVAEVNAANVAFLLARYDEALFHADAALLVRGASQPQVLYTRALVLRELGFAPQAAESMRQARDAGFGGKDAEIASFLLDVAGRCEAAEMPAAAEAGYLAAVDAAPDGPLHDAAAAALKRLRTRSLSAGDVATERSRIANLAGKLASLPRACPAQRGMPRSK